MTTPAPKIDPQQKAIAEHALTQHTLALLAVQKAAQALLDVMHPDEFSPEEKLLAHALSNSWLKHDRELLQLIEGMLFLVLPGEDILSNDLGIKFLKNPNTGEAALGIFVTLQPGKNLLKVMGRESAEKFEKMLKTEMDKHFGRLIKL